MPLLTFDIDDTHESMAYPRREARMIWVYRESDLESAVVTLLMNGRREDADQIVISEVPKVWYANHGWFEYSQSSVYANVSKARRLGYFKASKSDLEVVMTRDPWHVVPRCKVFTAYYIPRPSETVEKTVRIHR